MKYLSIKIQNLNMYMPYYTMETNYVLQHFNITPKQLNHNVTHRCIFYYNGYFLQLCSPSLPVWCSVRLVYNMTL